MSFYGYLSIELYYLVCCDLNKDIKMLKGSLTMSKKKINRIILKEILMWHNHVIDLLKCILRFVNKA